MTTTISSAPSGAAFIKVNERTNVTSDVVILGLVPTIHGSASIECAKRMSNRCAAPHNRHQRTPIEKWVLGTSPRMTPWVW